MGIDKRIVDSAGNEAKVDATDEALQVKCSPVVLETGGADEGTFTRGLIAETEVLDVRTDGAVASGAWDTITTYTVPAGNTLHITGYWISLNIAAAGFEFMGRIKFDVLLVHYSRAPSGAGIDIQFSQPIKAIEDKVVDIDAFHWAGANTSMFAGVHGFLTVDSEI